MTKTLYNCLVNFTTDLIRGRFPVTLVINFKNVALDIITITIKPNLLQVNSVSHTIDVVAGDAKTEALKVATKCLYFIEDGSVPILMSLLTKDEKPFLVTNFTKTPGTDAGYELRNHDDIFYRKMIAEMPEIMPIIREYAEIEQGLRRMRVSTGTTPHSPPQPLCDPTTDRKTLKKIANVYDIVVNKKMHSTEICHAILNKQKLFI